MKTFLIPFIAMLGFVACQGQTEKQTEQTSETEITKDVEVNSDKSFELTTWEALDFNTVELFGTDWALVAAGNMEDYNMMTISWGSWGWLWGKPISNVYVRPQRHTHNYTEREDYFTICFFNDEDKEALKKMGSVSGRDFDKMNYDKLTAFETENGSIGFEEAYLIVECRKVYATVLQEADFVDSELGENVYPEKDYHTHYVGEIMNVYLK